MSKGLGPPPPALLTRIVTFPKASTVAFTSASRAASSVTSQARAMAFPPALRIPSATASAVSFFRSLTATAAPAPAKSSAIPRPIPAPPPVTIATCPSRPNFSCTFMTSPCSRPCSGVVPSCRSRPPVGRYSRRSAVEVRTLA